MPTPHKHYEFIIAWAQGKTIEGRCPIRGLLGWSSFVSEAPSWKLDWEYRVKPESKVIRQEYSLDKLAKTVFSSGLLLPGKGVSVEWTIEDNKIVNVKLVK